ncbi:hypothetical protein TRFO_34070 [Tritrichomonas foetus]|uniref:Protein kinase domain-containing protein n=1 Tax=Tritrichomonas foetus TaxID=1144522 RepID=A0A1J4JK09_9EUKA|nr:hypothetical protein TRFO_34070 [Tritrichomonas foetus]|eukprot:OHS99488.1 hypothetical protein TRFO_34070 [Tritrichomonas foetus]
MLFKNTVYPFSFYHDWSMSFRRIHNYYVGEQIAQGSFTTLRIAYHKETLLPCALRMITKSITEKCKHHGKEILFSEKDLAPLLIHPNILKMNDTVETKKSVFQFVELCEFGDLSSYLEELKERKYDVEGRKVDYNQKIVLLDQILAAIEYLHSHRICHRDIKPENVLIGKSDTVDFGNDKTERRSNKSISDNVHNHRVCKLCDFGFSALIENENNLVCGKCGSVNYVAPEVLTGKPYDGMKADMWSLGVVIKEIFSERIGNFEEDSNISLPKDVSEIVKKLLVKNPKKRLDIFELRRAKLFHILRKESNTILNNTSSTKSLSLHNPSSSPPSSSPSLHPIFPITPNNTNTGNDNDNNTNTNNDNNNENNNHNNHARINNTATQQANPSALYKSHTQENLFQKIMRKTKTENISHDYTTVKSDYNADLLYNYKEPMVLPNQVISQLAEIENTSISNVRSELSKNGINRCKIIGVLLNEVLLSTTSPNLQKEEPLINALKPNTASLPSISLLDSFADSYENETQCHKIYTNSKSHEVYHKVKKLILEQNFCLTDSKVTNTKLITFNAENDDVNIEFSCLDDLNSTEENCIITLSSPLKFDDYTKKLVNQIQCVV